MNKTHNLRINSFEITLPHYMNSLSQENVDSLVQMNDGAEKIISCGVDPNDGMVSFLTIEGEVKIFNSEEYYIPAGDYFPTDLGLEVFLPNTNGRWPGTFDGFRVKSKWLIENSEPALKSAGLLLGDNYLGEINIERTQRVNT